MAEQSAAAASTPLRNGMGRARSFAPWRLQAQDFAWLLFVTVLIVTIPETNYNYRILVVLIGAFQILEPRLTVFASTRGEVASVALKMLLSYLLVGWTHGAESFYYTVFLIPVVSAATIFELPGVLLVTAVAIAGYFSFLLPIFIDYTDNPLPPDYLELMTLRASFFAIIAFLVYQQARAKRVEIKRTEEAAARLSVANRELEEAQASLRRSERLAALGQLTAGLAHELRNPLGTIRASAELLRKPAAKKRPELMDEMADNIASEVDRMNSLVGSFLDFARPLALHPAENSLREVAGEAVRDQAELARERGVAVSVEGLDTGDAMFNFDSGLLRLALANLLQNALQASQAGQQVTLRVEAQRDEVVIAVVDDGEGMPPSQLESVFNPFFTMKPKGIGLGLAIVAKIVDEHGGRIRVWSEAGKGAKFVMTLPRR